MAAAPEAARAALVALLRDEGPRVLATLVRTTGSLAIAEDAVQDAVVRALEVWPRTQIPDEPRAWLTVTARRRAIDVLRREAARGGKELAAMAAQEPYEEVPEHIVHDDLLRLLFTCCHPSLSLETQVALALRTLCGLSVAETGRALLVSEATMAKRLTRARQKIAVARIPYRVPGAAELPDRIRGVAATVYLLFNEGYSPGDGDDPIRQDLGTQALRLCRLLRELLPDEATIMGLLALVLLAEARRPARVADGRLVLMGEQDRTLWDPALIREGVTLVGSALQRTPGRPDPYVVQAAIAACHCVAGTIEDTDWVAIISWYDVLMSIADTPIVRLNRAVAVAERDGPAAGLALLDEIAGLECYALWHAARAELLLRDGRPADAAVAFAAALAQPANAAQVRHLRERAAIVQG